MKPSESQASTLRPRQRETALAEGHMVLNAAEFRGGELKGASVVFDLTGRSRRLSEGPLVRVEPGVWRARLRLELLEGAGRRQLVIYFGFGHPYMAIQLPHDVEGELEVELDVLVTATSELEIWLWLKRAAFHGLVRVLGGSIERVGDVSDWLSEPRNGAIRLAS